MRQCKVYRSRRGAREYNHTTLFCFVLPDFTDQGSGEIYSFTSLPSLFLKSVWLSKPCKYCIFFTSLSHLYWFSSLCILNMEPTNALVWLPSYSQRQYAWPSHACALSTFRRIDQTRVLANRLIAILPLHFRTPVSLFLTSRHPGATTSSLKLR